MIISAVDIGYKNFCIYIEEFDKDKLLEIKDIKEKYNTDGTPTVEMAQVLDRIFIEGKTLFHENVDISRGEGMLDIYINMFNYLESITEYLDRCDIFIIEQQMVRNVKASKLAQTCMSFFILKYKKTKDIIEFPAYNKTCVLGAPRTLITQKNGKKKWKTLDKPKRKAWSVKKACDILELRKEQDILEKIKSKSKRDDLADTLTMCQAFKYLRFIKS